MKVTRFMLLSQLFPNWSSIPIIGKMLREKAIVFHLEVVPISEVKKGGRLVWQTQKTVQAATRKSQQQKKSAQLAESTSKS